MFSRSNVIRRAFLVTGLSIAFYSVAILILGRKDLFDQLDSFSPVYVMPLIMLSLLNYALRFWRWEIFLRKLDVNLPFLDSLLLFLSTFVMVITPGKLGEAFKAGILSERYGVRLATGLPIVLAERIYDFLGLFFLASAGVFLWRGSLAGLATGMAFSVCLPILLLIFRSRRCHMFLLNASCRNRHLTRFKVSIEEALSSLEHLLSNKLLFLCCILSIVAWAAECGSLWLSCHAFASPIEAADAAFIYSGGTLVGSLTFLPGGIGGTEATIVWMLKDLGMEGAHAAAIALVVRLATLWLAVLIGMLLLPGAIRRFSGTDTVDTPQ